MAYLFGDSTPFPLDENFIETLRDVTDCAVALLEVDEGLDALRDRQDHARGEAEREQARLEAVASSVVRALEPHISGVESASAGQVAVRVLNAARGVLEGARSDVTTRRDASLREVETGMARERGGVGRALEEFFARRDLPGTVWRLRWSAPAADAAAVAQAEGRTPFKLALVMDLDIPSDAMFAHPVKVGDLDRGITLRLPEAGGWLSKRTRLVKYALDTWYVTHVEIAPERAAMTLRRGTKHPSNGLEIVMKAEGQTWPTARRLPIDGPPDGDTMTLDGLEAVAVERLWTRVEAHVRLLEKRRTRLVRASLENKPIKDVDRPILLAEKIITSVAPIVRDMRRKSSSPSEIVLKRDLENGRREELWVSREEIVSKYARLSPRRRALFAGFDLEVDDASVDDPTQDYGVMVEMVSEDDTHERDLRAANA